MHFNYIVPIFNKEDILPQTLQGIESCSSRYSEIFLIVDGCTDQSEAIVDQYIKNSSRNVHKILMPNVHMLLSVNAGLQRVKKGFTIVMQDDIILKDADTERKILELYERMGNTLGVISFRYGANMKPTNLLNSIKVNLKNDHSGKTISKKIKHLFRPMIEMIDMIKSPDDYGNHECGEYGKFYQRMCAINGPNVIPWNLLSKIGLLDENIAPYGYDDPEYSLRALENGFINGLYPIKYVSEEGWSGSSRSSQFKKNAFRTITKSRIYVYEKHKIFLNDYLKSNKL